MTDTNLRPLVAGNWKMNGTRDSLSLIAAIAKGYGAALRPKVELLVCPPAGLTYLAAAAALGSRIAVGGQDCHPKASGAHTGDVSAEMLADLGATYVILGHSERRTDHGESDAAVRAKAEAAGRAGLVPIVCVGETREQREAGKALAVVRKQIRGSVPEGLGARELVIAYEPVWAIGTGLTPTSADIEEVHALIRTELKRLVRKGEHREVRILYGGSVKPGNAAEIAGIPDVNGALVGGASLVAADFLRIAEAYAG